MSSSIELDPALYRNRLSQLSSNVNSLPGRLETQDADHKAFQSVRKQKEVLGRICSILEAYRVFTERDIGRLDSAAEQIVAGDLKAAKKMNLEG